MGSSTAFDHEDSQVSDQETSTHMKKQKEIISQDDTDGFTTHIETDSDADHVVHNCDNDQQDTRGMSQNVGTLNTEALVDNPDPKEVDNMQLLVLEEQSSQIERQFPVEENIPILVPQLSEEITIPIQIPPIVTIVLGEESRDHFVNDRDFTNSISTHLGSGNSGTTSQGRMTIVTEYDLVSNVLGGLGQEYDPAVSTITAKKGKITMQQAQFLLMSFESRLEQFASMPGDLQNVSTNVHMNTSRGDFTGSQRGGHTRGRGRGRLGHPGSRVLADVLKSLNVKGGRADPEAGL
ncbi:hypothetical protein EZV62_019333 [Acer yangbiense]|uniref:Uncharacterized protein n=1 Tax=Acer yangbiense TaxID=1000413 RepID=A0A5C7HB12_9ROSI|nr:hypothetical protein EZV62_019333 [Acer yangbiense]